MYESVLAKVARVAVRVCLKPALRPTFSCSAQRRWADAVTRTLSVPFGVRFSRRSLAGVPTEAARRKENTGDATNAVLFLHGGAFIIGSPRSHRSITGRLARFTGADIFVPDYRLAPEHPFPAALDDALACYRALLDMGYAPERIAVAGDSAGGGLALSLCLRLRAERLPQPACLALISPWADLTLTRLAPITNDALLRPAWLAQGADAYLHGRSAEDPLVSPLFADLSGLPRVMIELGVRGNSPRRFPSPCRRARSLRRPGPPCGISARVARLPALCRHCPRSHAGDRGTRTFHPRRNGADRSRSAADKRRWRDSSNDRGGRSDVTLKLVARVPIGVGIQRCRLRQIL